ncbi:MAG: sugar-binding transcriptional regulator, partial [Promicromonosporaceae bacterium]|nr:sugar-binding transcriptional regulator [Promicromonosporaceae bacterium]
PQLRGQLPALTGPAPLLRPPPGIWSAAAARDALVKDSVVTDVSSAWKRLTIALIGIGALAPSALAKQSGNVFPPADLAAMEAAGAVGDACFRFFDAEGRHIESSFDDRVIAISPDVLKAVPRRLGIAGGPHKVDAIRGAMLGGWINILVTDRETATRLVED